MSIPRRFHALAIGGLMSVAAAQAPVEDYSPDGLSACGPDLKALCKDVKSGAGRRVRCLRENAARVSPACKAAVVDPPSDLVDGQKGVSIAVTVDGIKSGDGVVWVLLSDDPDSFPKVGKRMSAAPARAG